MLMLIKPKSHFSNEKWLFNIKKAISKDGFFDIIIDRINLLK